MSNLSEFVARELREPTPEEMADILQRDLEERRKGEAERHERDIKRVYLAQPGATEAEWSRQKADILAKDRTAQAVKQRDAAQAEIARSYRRSF